MKSLSLKIFILLLFSLHLQSQEFFRQHPASDLATLSDLALSETGHGVAISPTGLLLKTSDYGENWTEYPESIAQMLQVEPIPNTAGQGFLISRNGGFMKTLDGGESWVDFLPDTNFPTGNYNLLKLPGDQVFYTSPNNVQILKVNMDGESWVDVSPPTAVGNLYDADFISENQGWVVSNTGRIYGTSDAGASWSAIDTTTFATQLKIDFIDSQIGYASVFKDLYKTTDGGFNWVLIKENAFNTYQRVFKVITEDFIVATNSTNRIYYTVDGGLNVSLTNPTFYANKMGGFSAFPDGRIWLAASLHSILYSTDFGDNFEDQLYEPKNKLASIDFIDENNGFAVGIDGTFLRTVDGGENWEDVGVEGISFPGFIFDVKAISENELWLATGNSVLTSVDRGDTFEEKLTGIGRAYAISIIGEYISVMSSSSRVFHSADYGENWTSTQLDEPSNTLFVLHFVNENIGFAGGTEGRLYKTTDAGLNWENLSLASDVKIGTIFFVDEQLGFILQDKSSNILLKTEDGGLNWTEIELPSGFWNTIYAENEQHLIVAGGGALNGQVIESTDDGTSWQTRHSGEQRLDDLAVLSDGTAFKIWVCGQGGTIIYSDDFVSSTKELLRNAMTIEAFPNPTRGIVNFQLPDGITQFSSITVFDLNGKPLMKKEDAIDINLSNLPAGTYFLLLRDKQHIYSASVVLK